ncbi:DUF2599 domain-containing protein [Paenibacillus sp. ClWae2A]|uniref:DUF2599 domain-containing protein n=1 Tax=Paenibacillus sp. ClWae2A TaxID=3057177 RepID=UPI0028F5CA67|nr:DUF2599 domain-containing protein [Paenibacillus sp. ClWae2A]MDT9722148.1 DUF2599 domain-containing protein [Paenibacillus sp. ClWae2A]
MKRLSKKTKFLSLFLSFALLLSLGHVVSANGVTEESITNLTTEDDLAFGVGEPLVRNDSLHSLNFLKTADQDKLIQTIRYTPSTDTVIEIPFKFTNGESIKILTDRDRAMFAQEDENTKMGTNKARTNGGIAGNILNKEGRSIGVFSAQLVGGNEEAELIAENTEKALMLQTSSDDTTTPLEIEFRIAATYYSDYFSSFAWITRSGVLSLSLTHTNYIYDATTQYEYEARAFDSWDKLYSIHSTNTQNWSNTDGMYNQYFCHVAHAESKNPWNIEPARPDVGYVKTVLNLCNPPL